MIKQTFPRVARSNLMFILVGAIGFLAVSVWGSDALTFVESVRPQIIITNSYQQPHTFLVEVANTPERMRTGLMNRPHLPTHHAMLFDFGSDANPQMWMKNTLIPLDMLFINASGVIVHIHANAVPLDEKTIISSPIPARYVLEIAGGQANARRLSVGDQITEWPKYNNPFNNIQNQHKVR